MECRKTEGIPKKTPNIIFESDGEELSEKASERGNKKDIEGDWLWQKNLKWIII